MFQSHRSTPKPWVAGSNPPAPAITEVERLRFFSFWCVLFCISLSKAEMTKFFNAFRSKSPTSLSNNSNCSNRSVWYSIKKAAAVSSERQKCVKKIQGEYRIFVSVLALIFVYTDAIFESLEHSHFIPDFALWLFCYFVIYFIIFYSIFCVTFYFI